jgi:hypothetical protein
MHNAFQYLLGRTPAARENEQGNAEGCTTQTDRNRDRRIPAAFPSCSVRAGIRAREIAAHRLPMHEAQWRNGTLRDQKFDRCSLTVAGAAQALDQV